MAATEISGAGSVVSTTGINNYITFNGYLTDSSGLGGP